MSRLRIWLVLPCLLFIVSTAASPEPSGNNQPCAGPLQEYQGWTVRKVLLTSPFDFMPAARVLLDAATRTTVLKAGDAFDAGRFHHDQAAIEDYLRSSLGGDGLAVTIPRIEACAGHAVTLHYDVFAASIPQDAAGVYKLANSLVTAPGATGGLLGPHGRLKIVPILNYNRTRGVYGGADLSAALPLPLFKHFSASPLISGNSLSGALELDGQATPRWTFLDHASWQAETHDYNVPVSTSSVAKATLGIAAFASSGQLKSSMTWSYGAYLGGGHVQDGFHFTPNSRFGEIKLMTGLQAECGHAVMSASYGAQIGSTFSGTGPFAKHLADVRLIYLIAPLPHYLADKQPPDDRSDFIGTVHRPASIELEGNAGMLSRLSGIPSVERFYGGNQTETPFIVGETWDLRAGPYIRSIPENRLGSESASGAVGGARFYSANLTLAKALWGRALVPRDLGDAQFLSALDGAIASSQGILSDYYFDRDPAVAAANTAVRNVALQLAALKQNLATLPPALTSEDQVNPKFSIAGSAVRIAVITSGAIGKGQLNEMTIFVNTELPGVKNDLEQLAAAVSAAGDTPHADMIRGWEISFDASVNALASSWAKVNQVAARAEADARANREMTPAVNVLNTLLYRLNVYSIAPVGVFDVARVWPGQGPARYGLGGGIRLSLVNVNFTSGYAFNPDPQPLDTRGAFFFQLSFTDLFH